MDDEFRLEYIRDNYEVFDRFTFDAVFRRLLADGYGHEEAKEIIMHHCALSALVLQERIQNGYYFELSEAIPFADDFVQLKREALDNAINSRN